MVVVNNHRRRRFHTQARAVRSKKRIERPFKEREGAKRGSVRLRAARRLDRRDAAVDDRFGNRKDERRPIL
jgi:hypothetical protein